MKVDKSKDTIYIDVDDEITNIIEKVKTSDAKIVALVLPKRATVLQSVVNMKLLKKSGTNAKKNIVLITSEAGLLPLAGAAGLHVAKSLQSKPVIPPPPSRIADDDDIPSPQPVDEEEVLDPKASIGALAAAATVAEAEDETETIELDNASIDEPKAAAISAKGVKAKLKHLKVPNFEKFRLGFFLAGLGVVLLIFGWYMAYVVLPKAKITITTDTTTVVSSFDFTATTAVTEIDVDNKKVPATQKEVKKTDSEKAAATGQRDEGTKASGSVTLAIPCADVSGSAPTIPAGTTVSTGGLNFITDSAATLNTPAFSPCRFTKAVTVTAAQNGDGYNIGSGKSFTVSGYSSVTGSNSTGFSGGTSKLVKVVSQSDIDAAVEKMKSRLEKQAQDELKAMLDTEGLFSLLETKKATEPKITSTPALNEEAAEFTVTSETTYTMLGIKREDLSKIIEADVKDEIDTEKQAITNYGIDTAIMQINNQPSVSEAFLSFRTSVVAGPEIDENAIKEAAKGKKRGEIESLINSQPGVKEVVVEYSPFWVYTTPKATKKITVIVEKSDDGTANQEADDTE